MLTKIVIILIERIFVSLTLSLLRDSSDFGTHLVYILLADTLIIQLIIISVDFCYPWLRTVRIGVERDARLVVMSDDGQEEA